MLTIAGVTKFQQSTIDMLRINKGELRRIPILTGVQASHFKEAIAHELDDQTQYIYTECNDPDAFCMRVVGDCMETEFFEGDVVIVSHNCVVNNNDFAVFEDVETREATLKQLKIYGDKIFLKPYNPRYPEIEVSKEIRIIGRVWGKTKRY